MRVLIRTAAGAYDSGGTKSERDYSVFVETMLRWLRPEIVVSGVPGIGSLPALAPFGPPPEHNYVVVTLLAVAGALLAIGIVIGAFILR